MTIYIDIERVIYW